MFAKEEESIYGQSRSTISAIMRPSLPQLISGWFSRNAVDNKHMQISHEAIYKNLYLQALGVLKKELMKQLLYGHKMRLARFRFTQFIETWEHREKSFVYYDFMCRDFFKWMANQSESQEWWRALGSGQYVWGKGLFQYKAKRCNNIAVEAINYEMAETKMEWTAKKKMARNIHHQPPRLIK